MPDLTKCNSIEDFWEVFLIDVLKLPPTVDKEYVSTLRRIFFSGVGAAHAIYHQGFKDPRKFEDIHSGVYRELLEFASQTEQALRKQP